MKRILCAIFWLGIVTAEEYKPYQYMSVDIEKHGNFGEPYPEFYLEPRVEFEGHLWRPIMLQHHPECSCLNPQ